MIDLGQLFASLGIVGGNTGGNTFYEFYRGVKWSDGTTTYTQKAFFDKIGLSRYDFFKQYGSEREFYASIDDVRIHDFYTYYKYAPEYFGGAVVSNWILATGSWVDSGEWIDVDAWID